MGRARSLVGATLAACAAAVSITPRNSILYSSITPKLRIQTEGVQPGDKVELEFVPPLTEKSLRAGQGEPIYILNATQNAVILGLKKGKAWPSFGHDADGTTLFLSSLKVNGGENHLEGPVPVAKVIPAPSVVNGEEKLIYATGTTKFLINGTGFREGMKFTFDPPLVQDVDYVQNVRSTTAVQLLLRTGRTWRAEPGPLKLRRVDVGGGALRIDPRAGGVTVAEVQADLGGHGVSAETTAAEQFIYQSAKTIKVTGTGFDHVNSEPGFGPPKLRWANGIKGRGQNYTTVSFDASSVVLQRAAGSKWRAAGAKLPGPLIALAADAGSGFVGLGPTEAKKGVRVATVFEDPSVAAAPDAHPPALFRTHTSQLWLKGTGFVRAGQLVAGGYRCEGTTFTFEPALIPGEDVLVTVFNRTHALVRLRQGKAWAAKAGGSLKVTAVQTGPMGPFPGFAPVVVGVVAEDDAHEHESGANVERSNHQVLYQTPTLAYLTITGTALSAGCALAFEPPLARGVDYDVVRATATKMTLGLRQGRTWRETPGPLVLKSLTTAEGGDPLHLAHGTGIVVADVVADPTIQVSRAPITATTTRRVSIRGAGFDLDGVVVQLEPTWASAFEVEQVFADEIVLRLAEGKAWTPSGGGVAYKIPPGGVPLTVTRVTTAAGDFVFKDASGRARPVQVATIVDDVKSSEGDVVTCDDSCAWALDGVCDDGSRPKGGAAKGGDRGFGPGRRPLDDDYAEGGEDDEYAYGYDYAYGVEGDEIYDDDEFLEGEGGYEYGDEYAYGYDYFYDDEEDAYGYYGDDWGAPACSPGTDCSDCGGPLGADGQPKMFGDGPSGDLEDDTWFDDDESDWWDDDYNFGDEWNGFKDDDKESVMGIITSTPAAKKPHKRHSGDHTQTHWYHMRRQKHGKEGPLAEIKKAGYAMVVAGVVASIFIAWAYHTKLTDEDKKDKCAPCKAALVVVTPKDSQAYDDAEAALGLKASKD